MTKNELFRIRVKKVFHSFALLVCGSGYKRANYIRKHNIFKHMGNHCYWHPRSIPQDAASISLGDNVFVAANVSFIAHDMSDSLLNSIKMNGGGYKFYQDDIKIGNNVLLGTRVIVLGGKKIGDNCVIGAGSVVSKDIPSGSVAAGNPIRIIGTFDSFAEKRKAYSNQSNK